MRKTFRSVLVFGVVLATAMVCGAEPLDANHAIVALQGVTGVTAAFGRTEVVVKIATHEVDIGRPSDEWPQKRLSSCTYSRFPCSLVDYVEISVNGNALFVARSVYANLADVGIASLHNKKKGQFVLTLCGGDASESYKLEITFDENLVRERTLISNESRQIMQKTTYFASQSMNKWVE